MQRYFLEENYENVKKDQLLVTEEAYHHMVRVMRMKKGERCFLVYADGVSILAEVIEILPETICLKEIEQEVKNRELPICITIACGYSKGDKFDWLVQKATELGVFRFIGFPAEASVVQWDEKKLQKKKKRLQKIAQEAAEQSQRQYLPTIDLCVKKEQLLTEFTHYDSILVAYEEAGKKGEHAVLAHYLVKSTPGQKLLFLFGPEGGFSKKEITAFEASGAVFCGLGPRILRAETAPLYVLSAASYQTELLQQER